jgi:hypothetical protein
MSLTLSSDREVDSDTAKPHSRAGVRAARRGRGDGAAYDTGVVSSGVVAVRAGEMAPSAGVRVGEPSVSVTGPAAGGG